MSMVHGSRDSTGPIRQVDSQGRRVTCARVLITALQAITSDLGADPTLDTLLGSIVDHSTSLGLKRAVVWSLEHDHLHLVAASGYTVDSLERFQRLPLDAKVPCTDATVENRIVICQDRTELFRAYPLVERVVSTTHALVSLPIRRHGRVVAGMSLHFDAPVLVDEACQHFLAAVANLAGTVYDDRRSADVLPLTIVRSEERAVEASAARAVDIADVDDKPDTLASRVRTLEDQMRRMSQLMMFIGALANERIDDVP